MNKICTTIEQSKKLIELGIDVNTADMFYPNAPSPVPCADDGNPKGDVYIPAWSLVALLELMPYVNFYKNGNKIKIENAYRTIRNDISLIDAAFEIVCWLKENGKL